MKVSVVITTYNRPSYLKRSLDGFLKQSHPPDEIVIADDGSSEETASLIETFRKDVTNINILHIWHEDRPSLLDARHILIRADNTSH